MKAIITTLMLAVTCTAMAQEVGRSGMKITLNITTPATVKEAYVMPMDRSKMDTVSIKDGKGQIVIETTEKTPGMEVMLPRPTIEDDSPTLDFFADAPTINVDFMQNVCSGSELNDSLSAINAKLDVYSAASNAGFRLLRKARKDNSRNESAIYDAFEELYNLKYQRQKDEAYRNISNPIGGMLMSTMYFRMDMDSLRAFVNESKAHYTSSVINPAAKYVADYDKHAPGAKFKELVMKDTKGKTRKLSEWVGRGKYVLVDFWASWCVPCMMEMPNLKAAYEKYKSKGLVVVGVSLDQKKENWLKAITEKGLTWNHISDLNSWQSAAQTEYGLHGIPECLLISPDGTILENEMRDEKLNNKLKEIFGE